MENSVRERGSQADYLTDRFGMPLTEDGKESTEININGEYLKFTHLNKVVWPDEGLLKRDILNYYYEISEFILPYLRNRAISLNRYPSGISGPHFYQKDVYGKKLSWTDTFVHANAKGGRPGYIVGNDKASLLWMVEQDCIAIDPWLSNIHLPDRPDYCVIDVVPGSGDKSEEVIKAALAIKRVFDAIDVPCFPKTTGSGGMHIYVPLDSKYFYDQSQMQARMIAVKVHDELEGSTTLECMNGSRQGKIYLNFLQNREEGTLTALFSLTPNPGATVSMPLDWEEIKPGLKMEDFNFYNALDWLTERGDPFKGILGPGVNLGVAIKKAQRIFK